MITTRVLRHIAAVSAITFVLAGCGAVVPVSVGTVVGSDKTVVDHVVSWSSGKNCSQVRVERGLHYCEEDTPTANPEVYCYKTLGSVTCYAKPDPHDPRSRKIGENEHNMVKRAPVRR